MNTRPQHPDNQAQSTTTQPRIALTAKWFTYPDRFHWIQQHGFAMEYTPDPDALHLLAPHVSPMLDAGVMVRYHGFLPEYEFAHRDAETAKRGLDKHIAVVNALQGYGEQVITVHIGLKPDDPIDEGRAVDNLTQLTTYARERGITVCLENLRRGPTSHPETVARWAQQAGAMITLDLGHALSCQLVLDGDMTGAEFLATVRTRLREIHLYERETDRHYPPTDMHILGPLLDDLPPECDWWTIELDDYDEALFTRSLALSHWNSRSRRAETD